MDANFPEHTFSYTLPLVGFYYSIDKASIWGARPKLADSRISSSEAGGRYGLGILSLQACSLVKVLSLRRIIKKVYHIVLKPVYLVL